MMRRSSRLAPCVGALWVILTSAAASGQDGGVLRPIEEISIEDLLNMTVSVASGRSERVEDAPGSVTVITRQQIADMNAHTLRDVMNIFVPGMDVVPTYFQTGDSVNEGIYSRGLLSAFSQQIMVLLNGQAKFNDPTFASPFPALRISVENLERIEISRSPVPLYGGGSIVVIDLITRDQFVNGAEASSSYSFTDLDAAFRFAEGAYNVTAVAGKDIGDWHVSGSTQYFHDRGQAHPEAAGRGGFPYSASTLRDASPYSTNSTIFVRRKDRKFEFQVSLMDTQREAFLSGLVPSQNERGFLNRASNRGFILKYRPIPSLQLSIASRDNRWSITTEVPSEAFGHENLNFYNQLEARYEAKFELLGSHTLVAGLRLDLESQSISRAYVRDGAGFQLVDDQVEHRDRTVLGAYAEDEWRLRPNLSLVAGLRFDSYFGYGDITDLSFNPRVSAAWSPFDWLLIKALYASSVRPPSGYERFGTFRAPLVGSSDVRPERVQTAELSFVLRNERLRLQLTPFYEAYSNKIEFIDDGSGALVARNNGRTEVYGGEATLWYYFSPRNYLFLTAARFRSYDLAGQHLTWFVPDQYVSGGANVGLWDFNLNVTAYFRGPRRLPAELPVNTRFAGGATFRPRATLSYFAVKDLRVFLSADNFIGTHDFVPVARDGVFVPLRSTQVELGVAYQPELRD